MKKLLMLTICSFFIYKLPTTIAVAYENRPSLCAKLEADALYYAQDFNTLLPKEYGSTIALSAVQSNMLFTLWKELGCTNHNFLKELARQLTRP